MKSYSVLTCLAVLPATSAFGVGIFQPGDATVAIDVSPDFSSSYPGGEAPANVIDGDTFTKYLNFGKQGAGFIVTADFFGTSTVQSLALSTANDFPGRDPASYALYGTNDAILSVDNSDGNGGENWSLISNGALTLPPIDIGTGEVERFAPYPIVDFVNSTAYTSYKLVFPTLVNNDELFQLSEAQLYTGAGGTGDAVLDEFDTIIAINETALAPPLAEDVPNAIDGDTGTKYLNFGKEGSGLIVTPASGSSIAKAIQITAANDFDTRDPTSYEVYGTNDTITSGLMSTGDDENWTLIDSGSYELTPGEEGRLQPGPLVEFENSTAYTSYRIVFPTIRDESATNSFQISEVQLFDAVLDPADLDQDGDVDDADFALFFAAFSGPGVPTGNPAADLDGDNDTDDADFGLAFAAFTGPGGGVPAPEPTSLALLGLGGLLATRRRRQA